MSKLKEMLRLMEQFLEDRYPYQAQELTADAYRGDISSFLEWLDSNEVQLETVEEGHITAYAERLRGTLPQIASRARAIVALRQFFSYLVYEEKFLPEDPSAQIAVPTVPKSSPKSLTLEQIESLLDSPAGDDPAALRDSAILEVLYGCCLRVSELVGLKMDDVKLGDEELWVFGKGGKERVVPLGEKAHDALKNWLSGAGRDAVLSLRATSVTKQEKAVFLSTGGPKRGQQLSRQGAWKVIRGHGDRGGLGKELTPHALRHSGATHMLVGGADIRYVQELLGHSSIRTTQLYTALREEELFAIYVRSHPRAEVRLKDE